MTVYGGCPITRAQTISISFFSPVIRFSGDFFYFKRRIIYIMLFFYLLDKWCELVYTNSVVNREVIRNVVDIL